MCLPPPAGHLSPLGVPLQPISFLSDWFDFPIHREPHPRASPGDLHHRQVPGCFSGLSLVSAGPQFPHSPQAKPFVSAPPTWASTYLHMSFWMDWGPAPLSAVHPLFLPAHSLICCLCHLLFLCHPLQGFPAPRPPHIVGFVFSPQLELSKITQRPLLNSSLLPLLTLPEPPYIHLAPDPVVTSHPGLPPLLSHSRPGSGRTRPGRNQPPGPEAFSRLLRDSIFSGS